MQLDCRANPLRRARTAGARLRLGFVFQTEYRLGTAAEEGLLASVLDLEYEVLGARAADARGFQVQQAVLVGARVEFDHE